MKTALTLSEKRLICDEILEYWKRIDATDKMLLTSAELVANDKLMTELSSLSSKIRYHPPIKHKRSYEIEFTQREIEIIQTAFKYKSLIFNP